jgi:hypothetical protein
VRAAAQPVPAPAEQPVAPKIEDSPPAPVPVAAAPIVTAMASTPKSAEPASAPQAPQKAQAVELDVPAAAPDASKAADTRIAARETRAPQDQPAVAEDVPAPATTRRAYQASKAAPAPVKTAAVSEGIQGRTISDAKPAAAAKTTPASKPASPAASKPPVASDDLPAAHEPHVVPATRASTQPSAEASLASAAAPATQPRHATPAVADADAEPSRGVVLEAGPFADAKHAYALRYDLGERLGDEHVLVARLDPPDGPPVYSVRIVGLGSSREVADAEAALHSLGHDPVRYEKPGTFARLGRRMRPIWAGLFSR